jgi:hypothetical protein
MDHTDRRVRQAAFEGGNRRLAIRRRHRGSRPQCASRGLRLTLNRHRGVEHFLDIALFQAAISRKTLNAMFEALMASLEIPGGSCA